VPDWFVNVLISFISAASGAGGVVAYLRYRADTRLSAEAQQDKHTLDLINALGASETDFRNAVLAAYQSEVQARRDLDARLTTAQNLLTIVTLERDDLKHKLEKAQAGLEHAQADLDQAHQKIRRMEDEIAALRAQQQTTGAT